MERLFDFLSECLALEQGGIRLLMMIRDRTQNPELRGRFQMLLTQLERHTDALQGAIRDLGGNPIYISPLAQAQHEWIRFMLYIHGLPRYQQLIDVSSLLSFENKDYGNWSLLRSMIPFLDDEKAMSLLENLTDVIEDEKEERVNWVKNTYNRLVLRLLGQPLDEWSEAA